MSRESYVTTDVRDVRGLVSSYLNVPIDGCEVLCKHSAATSCSPHSGSNSHGVNTHFILCIVQYSFIVNSKQE